VVGVVPPPTVTYPSLRTVSAFSLTGPVECPIHISNILVGNQTLNVHIARELVALAIV